MSGHTVILNSRYRRELAKRLVEQAPAGFVMSLREPKRTDDQNAKMWAMLSDISRSKPDGRAETPDMWKALAMHACGHEQQFAMGLDNRPFPLGFRSSALTKAQMSDLIEFLYAFGARHGIAWSEPANDQAA